MENADETPPRKLRGLPGHSSTLEQRTGATQADIGGFAVDKTALEDATEPRANMSAEETAYALGTCFPFSADPALRNLEVL